jgi:hypothetical protein
MFMLAIGQAAEEALQVRHGIAKGGDSGADPVASHQPRYPVLTHADAVSLQLAMHAGTAIEAAAGLMDPGDLLHKGGVLLRPWT